jgi:spermidine/putrescine transport system permease protein
MNQQRPAYLLFLYYLGLVALLYIPIAVLFLFSVNSNTSLSFPLQGLSFTWYEKLFETPEVLAAARNSLVVAAGSSLAATVLGTMVSLLYVRYDFRLKGFSFLHVERSLWTVGFAHTVIALPYALLIVSSRLAGFDVHLEEAAMDLGADYPVTLRRVVLPMIFPAIISAWLTSFTVSFDEFALALFLAGTKPTFPVYLFSQLRFANRLPIMIALAVLLMIGTLLLVFLAERIQRVS